MYFKNQTTKIANLEWIKIVNKQNEEMKVVFKSKTFIPKRDISFKTS